MSPVSRVSLNSLTGFCEKGLIAILGGWRTTLCGLPFDVENVVDQTELELFQLVIGANDSSVPFSKEEMSVCSLTSLSESQAVP